MFFDIAVLSDPFLAGIVLDNVAQVTAETDPPQSQEIQLLYAL
jgi:hypothetical protein